ncbi:MAG: hypothetical protein HRU33_02245 [Rhodobacteraceae bacterium]|nr:hypothetical protein [Paracoccaceae bacterium]
MITADGADQDEVTAAVRGASQFSVKTVKPHHIPKHLTADHADLVIVDLQKLEAEEVQILTTIRAQAANVPLIVMSSELPPEAMRQLFKFNVQDWLNQPVTADQLLASVLASVRKSRVRKNRVHAVVSSVGGAGATTTAINMADLVATKLFRKKPDVALFDLDFSTGNCGYVLNMVNRFNLSSVIDTPQRIDSEFIRTIQQQHKRGFYLYSFKHPEMSTDLNGYELVLRLLDAVSLEHGQTFLDLPYYETEWKEDVLAAVNTCTLITELNLPALKHTIDMIDRIRGLRGEAFPMRIIVNKRVSSLFGQRISKRKLRELFKGVPFSFLPLESNLIGEAVDRGMLPSEISGRNPFIKSLVKYLKTIELTAETPV